MAYRAHHEYLDKQVDLQRLQQPYNKCRQICPHLHAFLAAERLKCVVLHAKPPAQKWGSQLALQAMHQC